ncbi:MAG TPA: arsenate reductase family protein, partial [Caulobacteraceae bacterium]|nr:arsenate reductase family protein [Caulobacteraceae bacterium]
MTEFPVVVFHNPACGTSRNVVAMIRAAGYEPEIIEYLQTGWTMDQLENLLAAMGARPRDILREKDTPAAELGLLGEDADDAKILEAMIAQPILVNRPIVVSYLGTKL